MRVRINNPKFRKRHARGYFPNDLTFGFENEIVCDYECAPEKMRDKMDHYFSNHPYLYAKEECSNNGIEVNSHPFDWNWFRKNKGFVEELCALKNTREFYVNSNCGLHVHLSRNFFNLAHLKKMVEFFYNPSNTKFLFKISGRSKGDWDAFCTTDWASKFIDALEIDEEKYEDGKAFLKINPTDKSYLKMVKWGKCHFNTVMCDKGCALNLYPSKTIEVRIFNGTLDPVRLHGSLQFVFALTMFTRKTPIRKVNVENFIKFIKKNRAKYSLGALISLIKIRAPKYL